MDTQGWRQSTSAKMSGMGFCSSCVGVVVGATQQLYYKSPFPSHFGEGIEINKPFSLKWIKNIWLHNWLDVRSLRQTWKC
jgi:hypothetical protein